MNHDQMDAGVISVEEAIEKALETKKSRRPSYVRDLRKRWRRFGEWLPAAKRKSINTISQVDVRRYLTARKLNPQGAERASKFIGFVFLDRAALSHACKSVLRNQSQATLKVGKTKCLGSKFTAGNWFHGLFWGCLPVCDQKKLSD